MRGESIKKNKIIYRSWETCLRKPPRPAITARYAALQNSSPLALDSSPPYWPCPLFYNGPVTGPGPLPFPRPDLVGANPRRLGPVIGVRNLAEPGVLQRLLCCNALRRVVDKYLLEKIQKLRQELGGWRNDILNGLAAGSDNERSNTYR
jgi:hypothetical protein